MTEKIGLFAENLYGEHQHESKKFHNLEFKRLGLIESLGWVIPQPEGSKSRIPNFLISSTAQIPFQPKLSEDEWYFCCRYQDIHNQSFVMMMASGRWLGVRLDLLTATLTGVVAFAAILVSQDAGRYNGVERGHRSPFVG